MDNYDTCQLQSYAITKKEEKPNSKIELKVENNELIDVKTGKSTGKNYEECFKVMLNIQPLWIEIHRLRESIEC